MTSFVQGEHTYYVPVEPERGPDGRGRAMTYVWPDNVIEVDLETSQRTPYDVVIVQRAHELTSLVDVWLGTGRRAGTDVPLVYVEHDTPSGDVAEMRHVAADRPDICIVHVTHFNALFWDCGRAKSRVIEHAIVDPGYRFSGSLPRTAVVINEAKRRGRIVGTDLLERFATVAPVDLFGMGADAFGGYDNLPQERLHDEVARRRAYLHPNRWTSLGLSLIEAMYLGMPIVALATTEAHEALPPGVGTCSTDVRRLLDALQTYHRDFEFARNAGLQARAYAQQRYGIDRFVRDWNDIFQEATA